MDTFLLRYSVGPLLYCPAANKTVSESIINEKFGRNYSLALCLEDTIDDNHVEEAEHILVQTLTALFHTRMEKDFFLPKIFIRIRYREQISSLYRRLGQAGELVTGFIVPKFSLHNAASYIEEILAVNSLSSANVYMMPILENPAMIHLQKRYEILYGVKEKLDKVSDLILNVRVGGNDLSHAFGFRRQCTETIYEIQPIASILSDIMTVFGMDYVVSGPVFEYYNGPHWEQGLIQEIKKDRLNGFVGKTVIHPKQIDAVNQVYAVSRMDYEDALSILNWKPDTMLLVSGNTASERMNEHKTHANWAKKILALAEVYGVAET